MASANPIPKVSESNAETPESRSGEVINHPPSVAPVGDNLRQVTLADLARIMRLAGEFGEFRPGVGERVAADDYQAIVTATCAVIGVPIR